ncbi:MAG: hypothetical protein KF745_03960 [Phycisphaeraceae bacterium]|nr:hypothetical protein [Phycisphaeraceae bacterium]
MKVFSADDRVRIEAAIAAAEAGTSAQIVVVVARRSGRYDRVEDLFGLVMGMIGVVIAWSLWQGLRPDTREWSGGQTLVLGLTSVLLVLAIGTGVGAALASRFPALIRPFISRREREAEVRRRGFEAFHTFHVGRTHARNGLLIFVSLLERTCWVVGDVAIERRVNQDLFVKACAGIAGAFRHGNPTDGLIEAVERCGQALTREFPREEGSRNELPNTLWLIE